MVSIALKEYPKSKAYFEEYLRMVPNAPDRKKVEQRIKLLDAHIQERKERKAK
jgi:hypothetical protein